MPPIQKIFRRFHIVSFSAVRAMPDSGRAARLSVDRYVSTPGVRRKALTCPRLVFESSLRVTDARDGLVRRLGLGTNNAFFTSAASFRRTSFLFIACERCVLAVRTMIPDLFHL